VPLLRADGLGKPSARGMPPTKLLRRRCAPAALRSSPSTVRILSETHLAPNAPAAFFDPNPTSERCDLGRFPRAGSGIWVRDPLSGTFGARDSIVLTQRESWRLMNDALSGVAPMDLTRTDDGLIKVISSSCRTTSRALELTLQ